MIYNNFLENKAEYAGGAVFISNSPEIFEDTSSLNPEVILSNNIFKRNKAILSGGGAIFWEFLLPNIDDSNSYLLNEAQYGDNIASQPIKIFWVNKSPNFIDRIRLREFVSGELIEEALLFQLHDYYNQTIKEKSSTLCKTYIESSFGNNFSYYGMKNELIAVFGPMTVYTTMGEFSFEKLRLLALPNSTRALTIDCEAISQYNDKYFKG